MEKAINPFNDFVFINATPSERGSFTLATEKALAKLEKFQLPDPTFFILQWVQALAASGAQQILMSYEKQTLAGTFELEIVFDGPGYTRAEIDGLYDHVFRSGRDRSLDRLRELALGWLSACSLPLSLMLLDSNGRMRVRKTEKGKVKETTEVSSTDGGDARHVLVVRGKGVPELDDIVRRSCKEVKCRLLLNNDSVGGSTSGVPWPNKNFQIGPSKGVMGATYGGSDASHISFLRYGVEFVARPEPTLLPPVIVRVEDESLSKNVSQTDVVRDEAYDEFLGRLRSEMKSMGLQLTTKRIPSYQRDALNKFIQSYLVSYIDVRVFENKDRLELMGEEFKNLVSFPMFRAAGQSFVSLEELKEEYDRKGYLLYSLDNRSQLARWDGVLLILEIDEVAVLKKYFANLTALSYDEVRNLSKMGSLSKLAGANRRAPVVTVHHTLHAHDQNALRVFVPDCYPTGQTMIVRPGRDYGQLVPGVEATLLVENSGIELTSSDLARLRVTLDGPLSSLLNQLCALLSDPDITRNQSRMRYAELACELILCMGGLEFPSVVRSAPIIGLEDGNLVSIDDLFMYLQYAERVFLGGAFVEGLESGALDPMPCAERLLKKILPNNGVVTTASVRDRLDTDSELKFEIRRQTLMKGLAKTPKPEQVLKNFATEAAAQAELLAQMEKEYKEALKGPKLFVKPGEARLQELSEALVEDDFVPFDLGDGGNDQSPTASFASAASQEDIVDRLPSLESDLEELRAVLKDFCATPQAVHTERREEQFTIHLSTVWKSAEPDSIHLLTDTQRGSLSHDLPLEGFIRVSNEFDGDPQDLLREGVEQLVLKVLHSYKAEPMQTRQRNRLRSWLLECCRHLEYWSKTNRGVTNDLTQLPLVPCLGGRVLSLTQLRGQAKRLERTFVLAAGARVPNPDPLYDVITWDSEWRNELLDRLGFPAPVAWQQQNTDKDFDTLLRGALKELTMVVAGQHADLISPEVIGKLSGEASFWTKWRSGFLSWDSDLDKALINPDHKIGKKILKKYKADPIWSALLASALFSTINRGLEEVEDRHEKAFLEGLLETLE